MAEHRLRGPQAHGDPHALAKPVDAAQDRRKQADVTPSHHALRGPDGAPLKADQLRIQVLFPALESAGIKRQKSAHGFHLFRHSAASIVHAETRDLRLAQKLLGHSRLSTTADIYTHTGGAAEEATETLAREIWGTCGPKLDAGELRMSEASRKQFTDSQLRELREAKLMISIILLNFTY